MNEVHVNIKHHTNNHMSEHQIVFKVLMVLIPATAIRSFRTDGNLLTLTNLIQTSK